eukprot:9564842-Prorocentrum_lima.AAC.1
MVTRHTPPEECRDAWSTTPTQGQELWALMKAGGTVTVRGPGEHAEIRCPSPCWIHITRSSQERARPT